MLLSFLSFTYNYRLFGPMTPKSTMSAQNYENFMADLVVLALLE